MSVDVHWTGGLDSILGQACSVRVRSPMDVLWMSIEQVGQSQVDRRFSWTQVDVAHLHNLRKGQNGNKHPFSK